MSHGIYAPPDAYPKPEGWTVSLDNPWSKLTLRWYLAKKKLSEPLLDINRREIAGSEKSLAYLHSDEMKAHLAAHPEEGSEMARREKAIVDSIKKNQAVIDRHYASLNAMKNQLIRYGLIKG